MRVQKIAINIHSINPPNDQISPSILLATSQISARFFLMRFLVKIPKVLADAFGRCKDAAVVAEPVFWIFFFVWSCFTRYFGLAQSQA